MAGRGFLRAGYALGGGRSRPARPGATGGATGPERTCPPPWARGGPTAWTLDLRAGIPPGRGTRGAAHASAVSDRAPGGSAEPVPAATRTTLRRAGGRTAASDPAAVPPDPQR